MDYFGPVIVKLNTERIKVWVSLFTCLTTRAIHLEVITDLSTECFINCVRRFVARRGIPKILCSDNSTTFKGANHILSTLWETILSSQECSTWTSKYNIKWHFITPLAPWRGGYYERLIGVVKQTIKKAMGRKILNLEQYQTLITEAEAVANTRPLTYIYPDVSSSILRPIDFQLPNKEFFLPSYPSEESNDPTYLPAKERDQLIEDYQATSKLVDSVWAIWEKEYLQSLRERNTTMSQVRPPQTLFPRVGEIVLIHDEQVKRPFWKMGEITELKKDFDGEVRRAVVRTPNKKETERAISHLYPLELKDENKEEKEKEEKGTKVLGALGNGLGRVSLLYVTQILLILFITSTAAVDTRCKQKEKLTYVTSQSCVYSGIVIKKNSQGQYCWQTQECSKGHLIQGECKKKCECPKWALGCSFHKEPLPAITDNWDENFEECYPKKICAVEASEKCDKTLNQEHFYQIELYNGTKLLVESLLLVKRQMEVENYTCVGTGNITGTPAFCANHRCVEKGTKFCFYENNEITFFTYRQQRIPIRAWGKVEQKFYGFPKVDENTNCKMCSASCIQGGIVVKLTEEVRIIEICTDPYCIVKKAPQNYQEIMLPQEVVIKEYNPIITVWQKEKPTKRILLKCSAAPLCEFIKCYFCKEAIFNPQCASKWELGIVLITLYIIMLCLYTGIKIMKVASSPLLSFIRLILKFSIFACKRREANVTSHRERSERMKRFWNEAKRQNWTLAKWVGIAIVLGTAQFSSACVEMVALNVESNRCSINKKGSEECIVDEKIRVSVSPQGQEMCLLIKNPIGKVMGTVIIRIDKINIVCQKVTEYFTRSYKMKTVSSKRCPRAGSCINEKCAGIKITDKIHEFEGEPNDNLGFTHCQESCGCAGCGCFLCSSACLFYRNYVYPLSNTVYEVFSCPVWTFSVTALVKVEQQHQNYEEMVLIREGQDTKLGPLKLQLVNVDIPPLPILGKNFMTNGRQTVMLSASPAGMKLAGMVGALQCRSRTEAEKFHCSLPHGTCQCINGEETVSCTCYDHDLEQIMVLKDLLLPVIAPGLTIEQGENGIEAKAGYVGALELQIGINGMKLVSNIEENECDLRIIQLEGCYNCLSGAKLTYECRTNFGSATAHVTCGKLQFLVKCSENARREVVTLAFSEANIDVECKVECPAKSSQALLKAKLSFVRAPTLIHMSNFISNNEGKIPWVPVDIWFWALGDRFQVIIIMITLLILLMYLAIRMLTRWYCRDTVSFKSNEKLL